VLLAGVIMFPKELLLFQRPLGFDGPLRLVLSVPCGLIGLWTLYRVVSALLDGKQSIEHPAQTLGCVVLGSLPLTLEFAATLSYEGEYGTRWPEFIAMICLPTLRLQSAESEACDEEVHERSYLRGHGGRVLPKHMDGHRSGLERFEDEADRSSVHQIFDLPQR
jgi:hypothetical protein